MGLRDDEWLYSPLISGCLTAPAGPLPGTTRRSRLRWLVPLRASTAFALGRLPDTMSGARIEGTVGRQTSVGGIGESCVRWQNTPSLFLLHARIGEMGCVSTESDMALVAPTRLCVMRSR